MTTWLANLPHQIPFRAATRVTRRGEKAIEGEFLCTANDVMPVDAMLVEAMAQFGGGLVLREQGFLSGIDDCEITRLPEPGDIVQIEVTHDAAFGALHRFSGIARLGGVEIARARFYLAAPSNAET
jgi:3-hydroxymyristoyl/3-hydroxydecanoyl-(acyl carrier protein) dehydratase